MYAVFPGVVLPGRSLQVSHLRSSKMQTLAKQADKAASGSFLCTLTSWGILSGIGG